MGRSSRRGTGEERGRVCQYPGKDRPGGEPERSAVVWIVSLWASDKRRIAFLGRAPHPGDCGRRKKVTERLPIRARAAARPDTHWSNCIPAIQAHNVFCGLRLTA